MVEHILIPVDGSKPSEAALEFAVTNYPDTNITALTVVDPGDLYSAGGIEGAMINYEDLMEAHEGNAEKILEEARAFASDHGVEIETDLVVGRVSRSIVEYIEDSDVDHVIIGSHGRTGASRVLLGSVAETVTRRSPVPVTVVR